MNEEQISEVTVSNLPPKDLLLAMLLLVCEHSGVGFPITVSCGGTLVSGHIVPQKVFFTKLHEQMKTQATYPTGTPESIKSMVETVFKSFSDGTESGSGERFKEALENGDFPQMLHFEDAVVIGPDGQRAIVGLWRGRLGSVDGFSVKSF